MSDSRRDRALHGWFPSLVPLVQWLSDCLSRAVARGPGRRSAAVLRLLAVSDREGIPPARLLAAWARDERGVQATRVKQAAELLAAGAMPGEVVKRVPGLVTLDHAAAVCCGERLGLLPQTVAATLSADAARDGTGWGRFRATLGYLAVVVFVFSCVALLLGLRVIPQFQQIIREFAMDEPMALRLAAGVSTLLGLPAAVVLVPLAVVVGMIQGVAEMAGPWAAIPVITGLIIVAWLALRTVVRLVSRLIGGWLVAPFRRPFRRAAALDHLAVALEAGLPLPEAAKVLADCQGDGPVARSLRRIATATPDLAAAGLATGAEAEFFAASTASGVGPWALHTLAREARERGSRRALAWSSALVPVAAAVMGAVVLLEALAMFVPLVRLIRGLA
jgi:type II secretory pathway component PulF